MEESIAREGDRSDDMDSVRRMELNQRSRMMTHYLDLRLSVCVSTWIQCVIVELLPATDTDTFKSQGLIYKLAFLSTICSS